MDAAAAEALVIGLKAIGAGLAMLGAIGAGAGIGILVGGAVQGIARNPESSGKVTVTMLIGLAMIESLCIILFVL